MRCLRSVLRITLAVAVFGCLRAETADMATPQASSASSTWVLAPNSAVWLIGDSTLHGYSSRTQDVKIIGEGVVGPVVTRDTLKRLHVAIPVESLKSNDPALDKNMYKALKADAHPEVTFDLSTYDVNIDTVNLATYNVQARGALQIGGHADAVVLQSSATLDGARLHVQGRYPLMMSMYGIKPPTMMMGAIKVRDRVTIYFDLWLQPRTD